MKRIGAFFAVVFLVVAARADYRDDFREGIRAKDRGNWPEVVRRMRAAIAEKSQEGERLLIYGTRREIYLPHYYLGLAYQKTGNCDGANAEWDISVAQGVIQETNLVRDLTRLRALCPSRKQAEPAPIDSKPVEAPPVMPPPVTTTRVEPPPPSPRVETPQSEPVTTTTRPAESQLLSDVRLRAAEARSIVRIARSRRDLPSDVETSLTELEQLIARTRTLSGRTDRELAAVRDQLVESSTRLETRLEAVPAAMPPVKLLVAAAAFFSGDHERVLATLQGTTFSSPKAKAHSHLFSSASAYSLWILGGSRSADLQSRAELDARAARRLDPTLTPTSDAFSPRYIAFFQEALRKP